MAKVKSISIEGGAANPIADKGLDEALAETTMAATDSIPVKKAGGGFVYLDKNSLVSAVCQAFGIPAKNNNIGTALTHILGFNSGNGAGVATLAEAAQALGVNRFTRLIFANNNSDICDTGININAGLFGQTILVLSSDNYSDGNFVGSDISMIRLGYDGNNAIVVQIANSTAVPAQLSCSYNEPGHLTISGFRSYLLISNRPI